MFDFDERGFLFNFARGRMHYLMDAAPSDVDQHYYVDVGRSVTRQRLAFTPAQAADLRDFLLWNLRPENVRYKYDYYADNCTTRVRDALDKALGGTLRPQLEAHAGNMTYRQQTVRLMSAAGVADADPRSGSWARMRISRSTPGRRASCRWCCRPACAR